MLDLFAYLIIYCIFMGLLFLFKLLPLVVVLFQKSRCADLCIFCNYLESCGIFHTNVHNISNLSASRM